MDEPISPDKGMTKLQDYRNYPDTSDVWRLPVRRCFGAPAPDK